jgi:hypothetical protein
MDEQLLQDLNDIADFTGDRLDSLMPGLQKEMEGTPAWPLMQILGSFILYRKEAQKTHGTSKENYSEVHNHALTQTLALPLTQNFISNMMADVFNAAAGVQPTPTYDLGEDFE